MTTIRLFPTTLQMFVVFQLLHIWFKGTIYFSWWWFAPIILVVIIFNILIDRLEKSTEKYAKMKEKYKL